MKKPKLENRICELCGKEFHPHTKTQTICSGDHYVPCPICGKLFLRSKTAKCCSKKCSVEKRKQTNLIKYGVENTSQLNSVKEKRKKTMLERYGVEYPMQNTDIYKKTKQTMIDRYGVDNSQKCEEIRNKTKQTNLERYGTIYPAQNEDIKQKIKDTCLERYGVEAPGQVKEIKERQTQTFLSHYGRKENPDGCDKLTSKRKESCLEKYGKTCYSKTEQFKTDYVSNSIEKYGTTNPMQNSDIFQKQRNSTFNHYGVKNPMQSEEVKQNLFETIYQKYGVNSVFESEEIRQKIKNTNLNKYGVPWYCMTEECKYLNGRTISKFNLNLQEELNKNGIETELEYKIENRYYDFHIKNTNILLELNPTVTHTTAFNIYDTSLPGKPEDYHIVKTKLAVDNGYRCIHIWDWDNIDRILNRLKCHNILDKNDLQIKKVSIEDTIKFLDKYSISNFPNDIEQSYGMYNTIGDTLIAIMAFRKPIYEKEYSWELLNYCSKYDIDDISYAHFLFDEFKNENKGTVISYCDLSKFDGMLQNALGFTLNHTYTPLLWWSKNKKHKLDYTLDHTKEEYEYDNMIKSKWFPIYDCGYKLYIYNAEV